MNNEFDIEARRELGNGHWDRKLMNNLVALSNADNYNEAKDEWIATGNIWWDGMGGNYPNWMQHSGKCLCGHIVKYHFHIMNTENGNEDVVGSDHINTYMIRREISLSTGVDAEDITEKQIQEWMNVRIESMKADAWWKTNGEHFTEMFEEVKEYDLRLNVHEKNVVWSSAENKYVFNTRLRKSSKGVATDADYKMSSIVWRWNHPDNSRNQRDGRGYPNDRLWQDLIVFYFKVQMMKEELQAEDTYWENQTQMILEKQSQVVQSNKQKTFEQLCEYYGIPAFDSSWGYNEWSIKFLGDMKRLIASEKELSEKQQATLIKLIVGNSATEKQVAYLRKLGYEGEITTKIQASTLISDLLLQEE